MTSIPPSTLLDTDNLSAIMRQHPIAVQRAHTYLAIHSALTFSLMTRYEILRGLSVKRAATQITTFERLCQRSRILPITDAIVLRAAHIYADLHRRGELISDADILIAATCLDHGLVIATNNEKHYQRIPGLQLDNWLMP